MTRTASKPSKHYDCNIKHNGGSIFVARFQSAESASNFQKRNKVVCIEPIVTGYYYSDAVEGNRHA